MANVENDGFVPTVFDNYAVTITLDKRRIHLGLWDTAGSEEYNRLRPLAYPNSDVFLIGLSAVSRGSFENACSKVRRFAVMLVVPGTAGDFHAQAYSVRGDTD